MGMINDADPERPEPGAWSYPSDPPGRCTDPDCPDRLPQEDDRSLIVHAGHEDNCRCDVGHLHVDPLEGLAPYTADERRQISEAFATWEAGGPHAQVVLHAVGIEFEGMRWNLTEDEYNRPSDTARAATPAR
jgi:hypothetical protein